MAPVGGTIRLRAVFPRSADQGQQSSLGLVARSGAPGLDEGGREFIPTAELVTALGIDRATLSRHMNDLNCRPTRERIPTEDGALRQVRSYLIADIRTAAGAIRTGNLPDTEDG